MDQDIKIVQPENGISVLMPVHNAGRYLHAAVKSILEQDYALFELIVIDDHSTDGEIQSVAKSFDGDLRLRIIASPGRGIVPALNAGISAAEYDYIARMDSDDLASSNRLSVQLHYMQSNPEVDICGTKVEIFGENGPIGEGYLHYEKWINSLCTHDDIEREFFIESAIPHPSAMLRKEYLLWLGGYQDCDWPEDYDLWSRALLKGAIFGKPDQDELLWWRDHANRLSRCDERYSKKHFLQCKANYLSAYLKRRHIEQCQILGAGPTGLRLHDYLVTNGLRVTNFIDINPKLCGRTKRGKPIIIASGENSAGLVKVNACSIIICAVSSRGAREKIRRYLSTLEFTEGKEYLFAA